MATRSSHRKITGLKWARPCSRPNSIPVGRPRGAKAAGLRYERALASAVPNATHGQWFEFEDANGRGHCQPDLILFFDSIVIVLESKYTWTLAGHRQIEELYIPVLQEVYRRKVYGGVVCKVLTPICDARISSDLETFIAEIKFGRAVLHWIGVGHVPLGPSSPHAPKTPLQPTRARATLRS